MKANNFNKAEWIESMYDKDYIKYNIGNDILMIHNGEGHIIKLVCDDDNNNVDITRINVNKSIFFNPRTKIEVISKVLDMFKAKQLDDYDSDEEYYCSLDYLTYDIVEYCNSNCENECLKLDFIYVYYLLYNEYSATYFCNIENVTDEYVKDNKVMIWDELFTYTQGVAQETNRVYGFLDTYNNHYITMYDDYGNVDILEYKVIDNSRENKKRESNDLVEIVSDFAHIAKIDAPTQLSNYLSAFEFLMNNPTLFEDLDNATFMNNVDRFEGENNVNHNGIVKIAPLYTEVVFKYMVINQEIKLN